MNFNEKLTMLRKQNGLSQEELGYKLNVTRQTVSKWELGQTTPEMDKLVEISKLFNISVDELINKKGSQTNNTDNVNESTSNENTNTTTSETKIEDKQINKKSKREISIIAIIVVALVIILVIILLKSITGFTLFKNATDAQGGFFEKIFGVFEDMNKTASDEAQNFKNDFNEYKNAFDIESFNDPIERYKGTVYGSYVNYALDEIITSNKKTDKQIVVNYNGSSTQDPESIKNMKKEISTSNKYELSFEYDEEGYINEATIEKLENNTNSNIEEMKEKLDELTSQNDMDLM